MRTSIRWLTGLLTLVVVAFIAAPASAVGQSVTGEGNATVKLSKINKSVIVELTFTGEGPVQARPVLSNGARTFPWVDSTGPWSGSIFQEKDIKPVVGARVVATGPWTITIKPLASAPVATRGTGSQVIQLKKATRGTTSKRFTHEGLGEFKVFPISAKGMSGFASIEETGAYQGKAFMPPGTKYIAVVATGPWQMK